MGYDHRLHVGNAGDLWKHLVLTEVADQVLQEGWVYVETHAADPLYRLDREGEWEGGTGRCWPHIEELCTFPYFEILAETNPEGLKLYLGSAGLVLELARRRGFALSAELWDVERRVQDEWARYGAEEVRFYLGDGFSGVGELVERTAGPTAGPVLLFIDPPYIDEEDSKRAEDLICRAQDLGWIALCWYMADLVQAPDPECDHRVFELEFRRAGLECGRWKGAAMILAGGDEGLTRRLERAIDRFLRTSKSTSTS